MARRKREDDADLFAPRCQECGVQLVRTPSGYYACPAGHGKLVVDEAARAEDADDLGGLWQDLGGEG